MVWSRNYGGASGITNVISAAVDSSGMVFLTGTFNLTLSTPSLSAIGTQDGFLFMIDSTGAMRTARGIGGSSSRSSARALALEDGRHVYVTGFFDNTLSTPSIALQGIRDAFLIKYDMSGSVVASRSFGSTSAFTQGLSLVRDGSGVLTMAGTFSSASISTPPMVLIGVSDAFIAQFDSSLAVSNAQSYGGSGVDMARYYGPRLGSDGSGGVIVAATISGALSTPALTRIGAIDFFVLKAGGSTSTLSVTVSGSGAVTSSPSGISCGSTCSASFTTGTSVTLTATAASGYAFTGWSGDCSISSTSVTLSMTAAKSCTATFTASVTTEGGGATNTPPTWLGPSGSGQLTFSSVEVTIDSSGRLSASVPAGNFNATGLSFAASLSDGSALPFWLSFDPVTLTFTGIPPLSPAADRRRVAHAADAQAPSGRWLATAPLRVAARLSITLQVRDQLGRSATVTFPFIAYAQRSQATVVAASVTDGGASGNGTAAASALSDDGTVAVFQTMATNLVGPDANRFSDVVRYDVASGRLARFSTGSFMGTISGTANAWSGSPAISADGSAIAFASDATNIGLPWGNGVRQVWVADATRARVDTVTPAPIAASATADGALADGPSDNPALSETGRYVAFESEATNLVTGADTAVRRVYRKDRTTGAIVLVAAGRRASISADGRYVAFDDGASVFRKDVASGAVTTVDAGTAARLSRDARTVAYQAGGAVKRADLVTGLTATVAADGGSPAISGDGRFVAYVAQGQIRVHDAVAGTTALVSTTSDGSAANGASAAPAISGDGRFIAFASQATDLATGQSAGQLYLAGNPLLAPVASGWWWDPSQPGSGFAIETAGDRLMLGAFLYAADGSPIWYLGQGTLSAAGWSGPLNLYQGGQTLTGSAREASLVGPAGAATLALSSRIAALLSGAHTAGLQRYEFVAGGITAGPQLGSPETGWWWNADEPGSGWHLEIQSSTLFLAGFLYDERGQASWVTAGGPMSSTRAFTGTLSRCAGGQVLGGAYQPATCAGDLGSLVLAFTSPVAATMTLPSGRQVTLTRFRF